MMKLTCALLACASTLAISTAALAAEPQQAATPGGAPTTTEPAVQEPVSNLGDILVTARQRNERLLDVPVAISALSSDTLERYATTSLASIAQQVPQMMIGETTNQTGGSVNLRGIGAAIGNPSTEQAVTFNIDGVPISYGNAVRLGQIDLRRVEVLRGPQALFFGKNSPGGIISLLSNDPTRDPSASLRVGYELEADQRFIEGVVSGPLSETVAGRLVAYYSKEDGYFRNIAPPVPGRTVGAGAPSNNAEDLFLRGALQYNAPDGRLRVTGKVNFAQRQRDGVGPAGVGQPIYCPFGFAQLTGGITTDCKLDRYFTSAVPSPAAAALHPSFGDGRPYVDSRQFLASITTDFDISDTLALTSVTGFYKLSEESVDSFSSVALPAPVSSLDLVAEAFSQEFRLASNYSGPLNFQAGIFYQDAKFTSGQAFVVDRGAPFLAGNTFYDQRTESVSVFGQLRYALTETLEVAGGGRFSWESKSLTGLVMNTPFEILNPDKDFEDFSPEVTVTWKPVRDMTAYASYREGFTSGGFNTVPVALRSPFYPTLPARDLSFDQMRVDGVEVGFKGYLGGRQLLFDTAVYQYNYDGLQLSKWDDVAVAQTTQNAAGARVRGIEATGAFRPDAIPGLELRGTAAYNDARYTDFIGGCYVGQSIADGCDQIPRNSALAPATYGTAANPYTSQDQSGQRLARAPKWTLGAGATYDRDISEGLGASVSIDTSYTGSYQTQYEANPRAMQDGYWLINATASLIGTGDRNWRLSLVGRNLTNEFYAVTGGSLAFTGAGTGTNTTTPADLLGSPGAPRSVLLQLSLKY
jgi:iron complex outermembrane receptor protein